MRVLASILLLSLAAGCAGDNLTPAPALPSPTPTGATPSCVPNLDGVITAAEMNPALDVPENFFVSTADHAVDLAGASIASGTTWSWDYAATGDAGFQLKGTSLTGKWYAGYFPAGEFTAPVDAAGTTMGVYKKDDTAVYLLGVASTEMNPPSGRVLLPYTAPVALYKFPLQVGAAWTSHGTVTNGTFNGAPYSGYDTYDVSVDGQGSLVLTDMTFDQVLRIRTNVTIQPAFGYTSTRKLAGFFFECFGEVARATSQLNETNENFTTASEIRRLGLPPQGS